MLTRLLIPAGLMAAGLQLAGGQLPHKARQLGFIICGVMGAAALHYFYRVGFAWAAGDDFIASGMGQRLVWECLLIGAGMLAAKAGHRVAASALVAAAAAHAFWYGLVLHNPLWAMQEVGALPIANLLAPAFAIVPIGLILLDRYSPIKPDWSMRAIQLLSMVIIAAFSWASLRHGFHGTLLAVPGVFPAENILRSLVMLCLAISYLFWGMRAQLHDWRIASLALMLLAVGKVFLFDASGLEGLLRIASFVALGFSLIGIGWLYSRQLSASR